MPVMRDEINVQINKCWAWQEEEEGMREFKKLDNGKLSQYSIWAM